MKPGKIFLIGAGPGDPGLITVRGREALRRADVVVVDALVSPEALRGLKGKIVYVGKRGPGAPHGSSLSLPQEVINKLLVRLGKQGKMVARLKGGDPFVFGRGSEELEELQRADVPCEVIPGVSSAIAAPAAAGIPITERRWASQVTIVTGHGHAGTRGVDPVSPNVNWKKLPREGTLVVLMGVGSWKNIRRKLLFARWPSAKPVAAIESGTNPTQRIIQTTLGASIDDFERRRLIAPAVIVVGDVVRLAARGKRVVVTRPLEQNKELVRRLEDKGAHVISAPSIRVIPLQIKFSPAKTKYDWIVFLSANAARTFKNKSLMKVPVIAVGQETKRVAESIGWKVRKLPAEFTAQGVLKALGKVRGKSFLIPRVQSAPEDFPRALRTRGARVQEVVTYTTHPARLSAAVKKNVLSGVDAVTFTSASTVRGFLGNFTAAQRKRIFNAAKAVSMGPQTTSALRALGVKKIHEAKKSTIADLIEVLFP